MLIIASDTYIAEDYENSPKCFYKIDNLITDSSFFIKKMELSTPSMHLCRSLLTQQLRRIAGLRKIWVSYLKEWGRDMIEDEFGSLQSEFDLKILCQGQVFVF